MSEQRAAPGRPANKSVREASARKRRPMSAPLQKLALPEIPGYHTHWINDYPGRLAQAEQAGYTYVTPDEVHINEQLTPGNSDMGSRVSCVVGKGEAGQPLRAYAMKLQSELYEEDQAALQDRNDMVDNAIRVGRLRGEGRNVDPRDDGTEYVKQATLTTNLRRRF